MFDWEVPMFDWGHSQPAALADAVVHVPVFDGRVPVFDRKAPVFAALFDWEAPVFD